MLPVELPLAVLLLLLLFAVLVLVVQIEYVPLEKNMSRFRAPRTDMRLIPSLRNFIIVRYI